VEECLRFIKVAFVFFFKINKIKYHKFVIKSEAVKKKLSLEKILHGIVILAATALPGCYANSIRDAPHPLPRKVNVNPEWNAYVTDLSALCKSNESRMGKEKEFARYNGWLARLAGKYPDERFVIMHDGSIEGLMTCGIPGLVASHAMYWDRKIFVRQGKLSLGLVTHERGHMYDPALSSWEYISDWKHRSRMESVAEAFRMSVGMELIHEGNSEEGANLADVQHTPLVLSDDDPHSSGEYIAMTLMSELGKMRDVWMYLATHDTDTVFKRVREIEKQKPKAFEEGVQRMYQERTMVAAEFKHHYQQFLLISHAGR